LVLGFWLLVDCEDVGAGDVGDVDVVTDAGAIARVVVIAVDNEEVKVKVKVEVEVENNASLCLTSTCCTFFLFFVLT